MKYVIITKHKIHGETRLLCNIVEAKNRIECVKLYHICIDNVYRYDLIGSVIYYWLNKDIVLVVTSSDGIHVSRGERKLYLHSYRDFRDYVNAYRMR